jgi:FKBP-type peptidyl-prolyl cis-trans isomerase
MRILLIGLLALSPMAWPNARAQITAAAPAPGDWIRTASGLEYQVVTKGTGPVARSGQKATIHESLSRPDGRVLFDSRVPPNKAVTFTLGANQVIRGVEETVSQMRVGERRKVRVPPSLDGRTFDPSFLPPDAVRLYDIELLALAP